MEPVINLNCSLPIECSSPLTSAPIWQDVLAQAMTGELVAAMNYTFLSEICNDPEAVGDALEHAEGEKGHAAAFAAEGRKIGVDAPNNVDAKYWKPLRDAFMPCIMDASRPTPSFAMQATRRTCRQARRCPAPKSSSEAWDRLLAR